MAKSVQLPFCVPFFATTQGSAAAGLAIAGHPTAYNQILNQCISIQCKSRFINQEYSSPETSIPNSYVSTLSCITKSMVHLKYASSFFSDIVKNMLDNENYVYFNSLDDYYIQGKSWYGIRHLNHDGIICGYDDSDHTYTIAAYDINWVFNKFKVPQECLKEALQSSIDAGAVGAIWGYKVNQKEVILDQKKIIAGLKEYLDSNFEKYPIGSANVITGTVVHDYLVIYINKLKDGSIPHNKMDWRALRPIWEQKRCMYDRIKAIEKENGWNNTISEGYAAVVEKSNHIRMMYALYHKKPRTSILDMIATELIIIKDKEIEYLEKLIQQMEGI